MIDDLQEQSDPSVNQTVRALDRVADALERTGTVDGWFFTFHLPGGEPVYVLGRHVVYWHRISQKGPMGARTLIRTADGGDVEVVEPAAEVKKILMRGG